MSFAPPRHSNAIDKFKSLDARIQRYEKAAAWLEERLGQVADIRFKVRGRSAARQSYFGWVMMSDHPRYNAVPVSLIQRAMQAEGLPVLPTRNPFYQLTLFNLRPETYRIDQPRNISNSASSRILWLLQRVRRPRYARPQEGRCSRRESLSSRGRATGPVVAESSLAGEVRTRFHLGRVRRRPCSPSWGTLQGGNETLHLWPKGAGIRFQCRRAPDKSG